MNIKKLRKFIVVFALLSVITDALLDHLLSMLKLNQATSGMILNVERGMIYFVLIFSMATYVVKRYLVDDDSKNTSKGR